MRADWRRCPMASFTTTDGIGLAYYIDDFTDPW